MLSLPKIRDIDIVQILHLACIYLSVNNNFKSSWIYTNETKSRIMLTKAMSTLEIIQQHSCSNAAVPL